MTRKQDRAATKGLDYTVTAGAVDRGASDSPIIATTRQRDGSYIVTRHHFAKRASARAIGQPNALSRKVIDARPRKDAEGRDLPPLVLLSEGL